MTIRPAALVLVLTLPLTLEARTAKVVNGLDQYHATTWTDENGLLSSEIWAVAQDSTGYLWIGTTKGLVRFDGVNFVSWLGRGESSLPPRPVDALLIARDGSLWIGFGGEGGVSRMLGADVTNYTSATGAPGGWITGLLESHDGAIWAGSSQGLAKYSDGKWRTLSLVSGSNESRVTALYKDRQNALWVGTLAGVFRQRAGSDYFEAHQPSRPVYGFAEDANGRLLATDPQRGVVILSSGEGVFEGILVNGRRLLLDQRGYLWLGTVASGVLRLPLSADHAAVSAQVAQRFVGMNPLAGEIRVLFTDREGNMWIGTRSGLMRLRKRDVLTFTSQDGLSSDIVRSIARARDGAMWVATSDGLNRISAVSRQVQQVIRGLEVPAVHADPNGALWTATNLGIGRLVHNEFMPLGGPKFARLNAVTVIASDDNGMWWCDSGRGLFYFTRDEQLKDFTNVPEVAGRPCVYARVDAEQRTWFGFVNGDVVVHERGRFRKFGEADGLAGGAVIAIHSDGGNVVWVGSEKGLSRFNGERFTAMTSKNGVPLERVSAILESNDGDLWAGVSSGILKLKQSELARWQADPTAHLQYSLYDASDGLRGMPSWWNHPSAIKGPDGTLWFLITNGVAIVDPVTLGRAPSAGPVDIQNVFTDGEPAPITANLTLAAGASKLQIDYASVSLSSPSKIRYRYILDGFDKDWVYAGPSRQATYTNLPAGHYQFRVAASTDGAWMSPESDLTFVIPPRWYQTRLVYTGAAAGLSLMLYSAWLLRVRSIRNRFALILSERTRLSREIHDTLLQGLVGIALQLVAISNRRGSTTDESSEALRRLRKLVERNIREARESIGELRSLPRQKNWDLEAGLRAVAANLVPTDEIAFEMIVTGDDRACSAAVAEHIIRIGQEALGNAVRHADATRIAIDLTYETSSIVLRVADNGRGFVLHDEGSASDDHWGIVGMQERAERIGAQLTIETGPGKGACIILRTPRETQRRISARRRGLLRLISRPWRVAHSDRSH